MKNVCSDDQIIVTLNNAIIKANNINRLQHMPKEGTAYYVGIWETPITSPPLVLGENEIRVKLQMNDPDRRDKIEVGEFEIFVEPGAR